MYKCIRDCSTHPLQNCPYFKGYLPRISKYYKYRCIISTACFMFDDFAGKENY